MITLGKIPTRSQNESWSQGNHFYISLWVVIKDQEVMLTEKITSILCVLRKLLPQTGTSKFSFVILGELKRRPISPLCSLGKAMTGVVLMPTRPLLKLPALDLLLFTLASSILDLP